MLVQSAPVFATTAARFGYDRASVDTLRQGSPRSTAPEPQCWGSCSCLDPKTKDTSVSGILHTTCVFRDFPNNSKIKGSYESFASTNCAATTNSGFEKSTGTLASRKHSRKLQDLGWTWWLESKVVDTSSGVETFSVGTPSAGSVVSFGAMYGRSPSRIALDHCLSFVDW